MDVVEIDGASNNSVEDVRKLRDNAKYPPVSGRYKLYIIDEVHMLSTSAFNALLKTLEEPPKHLVFVFATTEPHKVPATILSRCQRFDFRRMQIADIVGRLAYIAEQEGMQIDEDALVVIARKGDGSMRDSQSIFDQVTSFCGTTVTYAQANEALNVIDQGFFFRVTDMMRTRDVAEAFAVVDEIMRIGYDVQEFLIGLAEHFRNFLTVMTTGSTRLIEAARLYMQRYESESRAMEQGDVIRALHMTLGAQQAIRVSSQPRLRLELVLVQLAVMDSTVNLSELLEKIDRMPDGPVPGSAPGPVAGPAPSAPPAPRSDGGAPPSGQVAEPVGSTYSTALKEQYAGKDERRPVKDLASFPMSAPVTAERAPIYTADRDSDVQPRPSGSGAPSMMAAETAVMNGNGTAAASRDVQRRWSDFLESCNDKMGLVTILQATQPPEPFGNNLRVYVPTELELNRLNREKGYLEEKLESFFKIPLTIEGALGAPATRVANDPAKTNGSAPAARIDHPFVKSLVELLEANPI
jgi:DNA polymerase-3 subunit gamma/tau